MEETTERLMNCLSYGADAAIDRGLLAIRMGMRDSSLRKAIHIARVKDRIPICNAQDGKGYFLPQTNGEVLEQYRQTMRRGKAVFAQLKPLKEAMGVGAQMTLDDLIREAEGIE